MLSNYLVCLVFGESLTLITLYFSGMHFVRWLQNFANNDDRIIEHNMKKLSYTLGHNQYSHLTYDQWRAAVHLGLDRKEVNR